MKTNGWKKNAERNFVVNWKLWKCKCVGLKVSTEMKKISSKMRWLKFYYVFFVLYKRTMDRQVIIIIITRNRNEFISPVEFQSHQLWLKKLGFVVARTNFVACILCNIYHVPHSKSYSIAVNHRQCEVKRARILVGLDRAFEDEYWN